MLRVWGRTNSINVQKVMWVVGELGLAHQRVDVGGAFGGLDSEDYGARNPNRRIPTSLRSARWRCSTCNPPPGRPPRSAATAWSASRGEFVVLRLR